MLVFRIIATVLLGFSSLLSLARHIVLYDDEPGACFGAIGWSLLWRAFVIVSLWII